MAKTIAEERLRWILPVFEGRIKLVDAAKACPYGKRSLERWLTAYRKNGMAGLEPKSTRPKTSPKETGIRIKERVIEIRRKENLCALKLKWLLKTEGIKIHERTIGKILKVEKLIRNYRVKKIKYKYIKAMIWPGELIEIDVKYVPGKIEGKRYFQYTAIDCASRWRHLAIYEGESNFHAISFLKSVIRLFPYRIRAVKTDNASTFTNYYLGTNKRSDQTVKTQHALDRFCSQNDIVHYLIDPGKPAQNGKVERSHRSDQETFYDRNEFKSEPDLIEKLRVWNIRYNNLPHCGLDGKSPNQYLNDFPENKEFNYKI
jgi:transposase InsO family protein